MSASTEGTVEGGRVVFELERFAHVDGRLEVGGRWSGIRGRRFLRPTLTAIVGGREHRALAVLEHKPWAAEDGDWWEAAFPWDTDPARPSESEISVAPDIAVRLPDPTASGKPARRRSASEASRRSGEATRLEAQRGARVPLAETSSALERPAGPVRRDDHETALRALEHERAETRRLRMELERVAAAHTEAASALARRDAALSRLEEVSAERDEAQADREQLVAERDALADERARLRAQRDDAIAARDGELERRHEATAAAVDSRVAELRAEVERERAVAGRMAHAIEERDAARAAQDRALRERDAARHEYEDARRERNRLLAERDRERAHNAETTRRWETATSQIVRLSQERDSALAKAQAAGIAAEPPPAQETHPSASSSGLPPAPSSPLDHPSAETLVAPGSPSHARDRGGRTSASGRAAAHLSPLLDSRWAPRVLALTALVTAIVLLLLILHAA